MSLTHGEVVIELNGTVYELRPTLKSMKRIQARFNGLRGAMEAIAQLNVEHVAAIVAAGSDAQPRDTAAIEEDVFSHGVSLATEQVIPFLTALMNPKGAQEDAKPAKKGAGQ